VLLDVVTFSMSLSSAALDLAICPIEPSSNFAYVGLGGGTLIQRKPAADSDGN
jgi:hypothetical protein